MPPRPAAGANAAGSLASIAVLEPQRERRRRQLVEIAARVIEHEGVDAVRIPRIAELAGVGRTAIYRYFPRREELLAAVTVDFYERLRERVGSEEFADALLALRERAGDEMPPSTRHLFEAIWDVLDECGPAGLILRAHATARAVQEPGVDVVDRLRAQWVAVGLSELEAALVSDSANAMLTRLYFSARAGEIDRETALRVGYRALVSLVGGLPDARER